MMVHRVKVRILDWRDAAFVSALGEAFVVAGASSVIDSPVTAELVEAALILRGYSAAAVCFSRSADERRHGLANWTVARERRSRDRAS